MGKYLNGYKPGASEGGATPYVPPGWSEWDVAGNGYPEYGYKMNSNGHLRSYGYAPQDYLTNVLTRKGLGFIDRAAAQRKPFMLEIATFAPHSPYTPAPRDAARLPRAAGAAEPGLQCGRQRRARVAEQLPAARPVADRQHRSQVPQARPGHAGGRSDDRADRGGAGGQRASRATPTSSSAPITACIWASTGCAPAS